MFSTLRNRFGIPGVISVIALVFAMFGGAYAASNSSSGGKATTSAKAKKGPRGPKGATGPAGPAGAQGPAGPAGAKGDAGANGSNGGVGATGPAGLPGAKGATGATGATGFAGFTETLPPGKTETGTWAANVNPVESSVLHRVPISFPIPLPAPSPEAHFLNAEDTANEAGTGGCTGSVAQPTAPPGTLCLYTYEEEAIRILGRFFVYNGELGYQRSGTIFSFELNGSTGEPAYLTAAGSWAVTAPTS